MTIHHVDHCRLVSYDDDICENYIDDETHNSMKNQIETFSDVKNEVKDVPKIILWVRHLRAKIPRVGRHNIVVFLSSVLSFASCSIVLLCLGLFSNVLVKILGGICRSAAG